MKKYSGARGVNGFTADRRRIKPDSLDRKRIFFLSSARPYAAHGRHWLRKLWDWPFSHEAAQGGFWRSGFSCNGLFLHERGRKTGKTGRVYLSGG